MIHTDDNKNSPNAKTLLITITIAIIIVLALIIFLEAHHKKTAIKLSEYGQLCFTEEVLTEYINNLQEQGLDDLNVSPIFSYDYDYHYDKSKRSLKVLCEIELTSSKIDDYYTTGYNDIPEYKLANLLKRIRSVYTEETQTYTLDNIGMVTVSIHKPFDNVIVNTPTGREYKLSYTAFAEHMYVSIDGDWVYSADVANTDELFGETPYVGLSKDHINHTGLGFYDDVEYCLNYKALRPERRSATYIWYDENGKEVFSAHVYGDEVIGTVDRRNGNFIIKGPDD